MTEPRTVDLLVGIRAFVTDPAMTDEELVQSAVYLVESGIDASPDGPYQLSNRDVTVWTELGYIADLADLAPPGELARLYEAADASDHDLAVLEELAVKAGLRWNCVWCAHSGGGWTNVEEDATCDQCGGPRVTGPITFRCPPEPVDKDSGEEHTILGCGAVFTLQPDEIDALDDMVDCECGMFFQPLPNIVKETTTP